jgi:predicted esterase
MQRVRTFATLALAAGALLPAACSVRHVTASESPCTSCDDQADEAPTLPPEGIDLPPSPVLASDPAPSPDAAPDASADAASEPEPPEPPPPTTCSLSPNATGVVERSLLGGRYWTYVPASYDPKTPAPLVVALHGAGDVAKSYLSYEWQADADARGAIVVAPQGTTVVSAGFGWAADDRKRILAAVDDVHACYAILPKHTIIQGFSVGADMALFVGLTYANEFDAIAVASGSLLRAEAAFSPTAPLLPAARKIPVTAWRGTNDPIVPATDIDDLKQRLEAGGHQVFVHSFKGSHKTTPADALAQYDELTGALMP